MSTGSLHMSSKRPSTKTGSTSDEWKITDEWGIYDPEKAGIPALFARLGRPILRAAPTSSRKERRRALRPERSGEGVGLALAEARRRAGYDTPEGSLEPLLAAGNPARAMRLALRAQAALNAMGTPSAEPFVPPPAPPVPQPPVQAQVTVVPDVDATPAPKKRPARRAVQTRAATDVPAPHVVPRAEATAPAPKARARKTAVKTRTRQAAPAAEPVTPATAAPLPEVATTAKPPAPPAPSPRRPRGPVPLAAWAHAVADQPKVEPRRTDKRGFWRGIFRMPAEVALVEYAHGAKIHRLLIEAGDDHLPDFI